MSYAARTHRLSPVAHVVDDLGALCGARPAPKWVLTRWLPVNCPRCLISLARPRYAFCESPTASTTSRMHIRVVGPEGLSLSGNAGGARTLCGQPVGWDLEAEVPALMAATEDRETCGQCRMRYRVVSAPA